MDSLRFSVDLDLGKLSYQSTYTQYFRVGLASLDLLALACNSDGCSLSSRLLDRMGHHGLLKVLYRVGPDWTAWSVELIA